MVSVVGLSSDRTHAGMFTQMVANWSGQSYNASLALEPSSRRVSLRVNGAQCASCHQPRPPASSSINRTVWRTRTHNGIATRGDGSLSTSHCTRHASTTWDDVLGLQTLCAETNTGRISSRKIIASLGPLGRRTAKPWRGLVEILTYQSPGALLKTCLNESQNATRRAPLPD